MDWAQAPQPIRIKLKCLRGIRNKLPRMLFYTQDHIPFDIGRNNLNPLEFLKAITLFASESSTSIYIYCSKNSLKVSIVTVQPN